MTSSINEKIKAQVKQKKVDMKAAESDTNTVLINTEGEKTPTKKAKKTAVKKKTVKKKTVTKKKTTKRKE